MGEAWSISSAYRDPAELSAMLGIPLELLPQPQIDCRGLICFEEALRYDAQRRFPMHRPEERESIVRRRLKQLRRLKRARSVGDEQLADLLGRVMEDEARACAKWYAEHVPPPEPMTWDAWAASAPHVVERLAADAETKHSAESWAAAEARARARAARERHERNIS